MFPFSRKSAPILGIDISETAGKLLELSQRGSNYQVESYAVEPIAPNSVTEKTINDIDQVGETIASVVEKSGTKTKNALQIAETIENVEGDINAYTSKAITAYYVKLLADDLLFTKVGWLYQYNAIPNNKDNQLTNHFMKKTYEHFYGELK